MSRILKSALFVDFDNIFSSLRNQDEMYADAFAEDPARWVKWLSRGYGLNGGEQRDILIRKCYLNPNAFGRFRPSFITAAFDVVDCPPLTKGGKTSADIHMVIDVLDALEHKTYFDEFIIFSGDADFTPVLVRLREHARRTTVLSAGYSSPAYRAACHTLIGQGEFIEDALEEAATNGNGMAQKPATGARQRLIDMIKEKVEASDRPVPSAALADDVRKHFPQEARNWFGEGSFGSLLAELDLSPFSYSSRIPGLVYDPKRHTAPDDSEEGQERQLFYSNEELVSFQQEKPEIYKFAKFVHRLTEAPLLSPEAYNVLFSELAREVNDNGYQLTRTTRNVRDKCLERGVRVARQHVSFVAIGIARTGYRFLPHETQDPLVLAKKFVLNVKSMCEAAQYDVTSPEQASLLFRWVIGEKPQEAVCVE